MTTFICKRCECIFNRKANLIQHLKRKNICDPIYNDSESSLLINELINKKYNETTYNCCYCEKKFNFHSAKYRHQNICKNKDNITSKIKELESKLTELNNKLNVTNNITNNTQINLNGIKLRDFGNENMNAIPESLISTLFMDLRFRELLANLHCDPNYPENQNVRIKSIKRNTMEIFRNNKWDLMTFTNGLTELLLQGHKIFKEYYQNDKNRILNEDMTEDELNEILCQLDKIELLNKNEIKPLKEDIQLMLEEYKSTGTAIVI